MNDFKRCAEPYPSDPRPVDWNDIASRTNNMLLGGSSLDLIYAVERFNKLSVKYFFTKAALFIDFLK